MTMKSSTTEGATPPPAIPALDHRPRLDRVAAATPEQLRAALVFLSAVNPDAFDYAMSVPEFDGRQPAAGDEVEPVCEACGGKLGVFLALGLAWQHYAGDGMTAGQQRIYSPGHAPVVTWHPSENLEP
jgi:hypothetical protein